MNSIRKTAIIVGVLFITELVVHYIGSTLIEAILANPDYLSKLSANGFIIHPPVSGEGKWFYDYIFYLKRTEDEGLRIKG